MKSSDAIVNQILEGLMVDDTNTIDIDMFNKKWTFKLLSADDHLNVVNGSAGYEDYVSRMFKLQQETLKKSLISVDDITLSDSEKSLLFSKCAAIVVIKLYEEYDAIRDKKDKELQKKVTAKADKEKATTTETE